MAYASIAELKARTDVNILRQLSDDNEYGITVENILESALNSGTDFADNVVPSHLNDSTLLKEICLLKAQEILYRRKGYLDAASSNATAIQSLLSQAEEKHIQAAHPVLDSTVKSHTTTNIDEGKWESWFREEL